MECRWLLLYPSGKKIPDKTVLSKSLNQIYGWESSSSPYETGLIAQCEKACAVPIEELRITDLNTLVMQGIGLDTLAPIAIPIVENAPWTEAECYTGDLVMSLIHVANDLAPIDKEYVQRLGAAALRLLSILQEEQSYDRQQAEEGDSDYWAEDIIEEIENFLTRWNLKPLIN